MSRRPNLDPPTPPSTRSPSTRSPIDVARVIATISETRVDRIERAIELGVDKEDFAFASGSERVLWDEVVNEFEDRLAKHGPTWLAE